MIPLPHRRPSYAAVMSTVAVVLAAGGVSWAASLPKNSVGSPQVRNGSIRSVDVKNGTLRAVDFAKGTLLAGPKGAKGDPGTAPFAAVGASQNSFGTCEGSGWCFLAAQEGGSVIAGLGTAPGYAIAGERATTGALVTTVATDIAVTGSVNLYNPNGAIQTVFCLVYDGATSVASTSTLTIQPNTSMEVPVVAAIPGAAAGTHDITLRCRAQIADKVAARSGGVMAVAQQA